MEQSLCGYEFEGWYATKDASIKWTSTTPITESIDVYAKWEAKAYQVTYNPNGGSGTAQDENTYTLGATVTLHDGAELTYDGHYLSGWTYKNKFYAKGALFTMPAENVEFMAVWIPDNTYNEYKLIQQSAMPISLIHILIPQEQWRTRQLAKCVLPSRREPL